MKHRESQNVVPELKAEGMLQNEPVRVHVPSTGETWRVYEAPHDVTLIKGDEDHDQDVVLIAWDINTIVALRGSSWKTIGAAIAEAITKTRFNKESR